MNLSLDAIQPAVYMNMFYAIILLIGVLSVKFLERYFQKTVSSMNIARTKNKSKEVWIKILRENNKIDDYLSEYAKIIRNERLKGSNKLPIIVGLVFSFLYVFLLLFLNESNYAFWHSMSFISLVLNVISFISAIVIMREMYNKLKTPDQIYANAENVVKWIDTAKFYVFLSNGMHLLFMLMLYRINNLQMPYSDDNAIQMFSMAIPLAIVSWYELRRARKDFDYFLKEAINTKLLDECPEIAITTDSKQVQGNIKNIFDDDNLILEDKGCITLTKWVDVQSLKILENKHIFNDYSSKR